jgi:hypothetical protein
MFELVRRRPSPAMVVALLALFVALGPSAYATHLIVNSSDVVDESLTGVDIRGAFGTSTTPGVNGSLTGADVYGQPAIPAVGQPFVNGGLTGWDIADGTLRLADLGPNSVDASKIVNDEAWHEIGAPGQPEFTCHGPGNSYGCFANYGQGFNTAGFYKDALGVVHLKGLIHWTSGSNTSIGGCGWWAFVLPAGYVPAEKELHASLAGTPTTYGSAGRVDIDTYGAVYPCDSDDPNGTIDPNDWFVLDGITFRAAG